MGKTPSGAQKRKCTRLLLANPFPTYCPPVSDAVEKKISGLLTKLAKSFGERKDDKVRKEFIFGLNSVTRAVEGDGVCAVLMARRVQPQILVQQLVCLCRQRAVPLLAHSQLNGDLAKMLGLSSLMTMALKKSAESPSSDLHPLYKVIIGGVSAASASVPSELDRATVTFSIPSVGVPKQRAAEAMQESHFLPLSQDLVFPDPDYPRELDSLRMRVLWSITDLEADQKRSDQGATPHQKYLVEAQTMTVTSSAGVKKKKKKNK